MGHVPVGAARKLCALTGIDLPRNGVIERHEAIAARGLAVLRGLGLGDDDPRVNRNGSLGHPLGMSGARIVGTAALDLRKTGARHALATICVDVGQDVATLLERVRLSVRNGALSAHVRTAHRPASPCPHIGNAVLNGRSGADAGR